MSRPKLLDLFCGAGGAGMGYHRAGFDVVGVDLKPQRHYPFLFIEDDALEFVRRNGHHFDVIHASPPCQAYSVASQTQRNQGKIYPDLVAPTRDALNQVGLPWIIENVPGAPVRPDIKICGCQVGLDLRRIRLFETSWGGTCADLPVHHHPYPVVSVTGHGTPTWVRQKLGYNPTIAHYRAAMGIDWMNRDELSQAIPPAYTEYVGRQLLAHVERRMAA